MQRVCDDEMDPASGYCAATGIYHSKRPEVPLPLTRQLSLPEFLREQSRSISASSIAYVDFLSGASMSHAEVHACIRAAAAGLVLLLGVRKGDVLYLLAPNSTRYVILLQAALSIGAIVTTSNPLSLPSEIAKQAAECKVKFVVTIAAIFPKIADLQIPSILLDEAQCHSSTLTPHRFSTLISANADSLPHIPVYQDDTALLLYSSGTTGASKGVMLSHKNLIAQALSFMSRPNSTTSAVSSRVYLCILPMFHAYGLVIFCSAVLGKGCSTVILPKFDMVQMLSAIQKYNVTHMPCVPPVMLALAKSSLVETYDLSSLREIVVGAAPVSSALISAFLNRFPDITVLQGYALTESTAVGATILTAEESRQVSSTGLLGPNTEAKIVNVDSGQALPPNTAGEILLRGPMIMQGYLGQPKETATSVDQDGWLHTGDLGYIDCNGYLFIVDRLKELIKYNAFQIAPAELEAVLISHPHIQEAAVIPYPDESAGEIPMACVVLAGSTAISEADVMQFVAERVAPFKKIRRVTFVNSIPKSPSGKILRRQLVASVVRSKL